MTKKLPEKLVIGGQIIKTNEPDLVDLIMKASATVNTIIDYLTPEEAPQENGDDPMKDLCFCDKSEFPHSRHQEKECEHWPSFDTKGNDTGCIKCGSPTPASEEKEAIDVRALLEEYARHQHIAVFWKLEDEVAHSKRRMSEIEALLTRNITR